MDELLHFTATWCQPCKQMEPIIQAFVKANPNIKYTKVDVSSDTDKATEYGITGVPAFIHLKNGKEIQKHKGVMTEQKLATFCKS